MSDEIKSDPGLNPGIAFTVGWLCQNGFQTIESGDGVTKNYECDPGYPYVCIKVDPSMLVQETDRLVELLKTVGIELEPLDGETQDQPNVNGSYMPEHREAFIHMTNIILDRKTVEPDVEWVDTDDPFEKIRIMRRFKEFKSPGLNFAFECDKEGKILEALISSAGVESYRKCISGVYPNMVELPMNELRDLVQLCRCGSGLEREELYDARGIYCCKTCPVCGPAKRRRYRTDVLENPSYEADELIEPEEY